MVYKDLEEKKTAVLGWHDLERLVEIVAASRAAYRG